MMHTFNVAKILLHFLFKNFYFVITLNQITLHNMEGLVVLPFPLEINTQSAALCSFQLVSAHCFGLAAHVVKSQWL